jgi:O-antigen ligase
MHRLRAPAPRLLLATFILALLWASALFAFILLHPPAKPADANFPVRPELSGLAGVNLDPSELDPGRLATVLADTEAQGIRWVRFTLPWDAIEPVRGQFDWAAPDAVFAELAKHPGLSPLVVLNRAPAWARDAGDAGNPLAPPHERSDFGAFAAAVARRYGDRLRYYQVWHEPNIAPHWGAREADPAGYLGLLREAAVQIRAADADAQIVLAALAPTTEAGGANLSDITFLEALYGLGARDWFDIAAAQPYGFSAPPDAAADAGQLNFARAGLLRAVMERHDDGRTPLWAIAFGWNALSADGSPWGGVGEAAQAKYAAQALTKARADWPWLGPLFWAAVCPDRPAGDPWLGFALCDAGGAERPAAAALAAAAAPPGSLPPGEHRVDHPALRYGRGWRVTPAAADPGADGDVLEFAFTGTGLDLRIQGGPYWAYYRVQVDGQPANALPRDETGAAYLALHDPLAETRWAPVAAGLAPGEHSVRLEARGGWGQWALQGLRVTWGEGEPAWIAWLLLGLALVATAVWCIVAWPFRRGAARWLLGRLEAAAARPAPVLWVSAAAFALLLVLGRQTVTDLLALTMLGLLFLVRPDLSLPLIAASLPFWQRPEQLLRWQFPHYLLFLWLGVGALALRWIIELMARPHVALSSAEEPGRRSHPPITSHVSRFTFHVSRLTSLDWPILALLASGLLSTLAAQNKGVALREFYMVFLGGALFYWLITRMRWPAGRGFAPLPMLNGFLAGMVAVSLIALWQLVTGAGRIDVEGVWRVRGLYGSPNNLALVLDRAVPVALALALFARPRPAWQAAWHWAAAVIMALACIATFSKGALLLGLPVGLALVLGGGAWRSRRRSSLWLLAGLALAGGLGLLALFRTQRFADLLNFRAGTSFVRLKLWRGAWNMAREHPLLGVGPDNFLYAYRTRYVLPSAWEELNLSHPHNIALDLWTRLGLVGVLAGGWALIAAWLRGWRLFKTGAPEVWPVALGLLAAIAATLAHGLIDNSLFLLDLMGIFMMTLGIFGRLGE